MNVYGNSEITAPFVLASASDGLLHDPASLPFVTAELQYGCVPKQD
jgi:hypothetical protein